MVFSSQLKKVQPTALIKEYGIPPEDYKYVADVIRDSCDMVGKDIGRKVSDLRKEQKAAKLVAAESIPTATPAKSVSRTPSKSVLKSGSSYASSPTKTPSQKRKVVFSSVDEEDGSTLDTPTRKRPKLTNLLNPNHRTPHSNVLPALTFPSVDEEETSYPASSSKVMQDLLQATYDPTTDNDSSTDVDGPSSPSRSAPSTPRHPTHSTIDPVAPSDREQTPRKRKTSQGLNLKPPPAEDDEITRPRRCRPILLSHRQWFLRDPRVEMEWRLAESAKQTLIQNHGHPFQHLGGPSMSMGTT